MVATIDSIRVECSCGKKARVPARYAGRRVRCTRCKAQLRVPGSGSSLEALDREVARNARSPRRNEPASERQARPRSSVKSADPYAPPKAVVDAPRRIDRNRANRDLAAEAHIQAIGVWQRIQGVLAGLAGVALLLLGGARGVPMAVIVIGIAAFCYWLGSSLMTYRGWSRIVVGLFTALGLLGCVASIVAAPNAAGLISNLIPGAWNVAILWALFSSRAARVFAPGYRIDNQRVTWWASPFFWAPFAMIALAALLGIAASFALA